MLYMIGHACRTRVLKYLCKEFNSPGDAEAHYFSTGLLATPRDRASSQPDLESYCFSPVDQATPNSAQCQLSLEESILTCMSALDKTPHLRCCLDYFPTV